MKSSSARFYIWVTILGVLLTTVVVVVVRYKAHQDRVSRLQSTLSSDEKNIAIFDDRSERIKVSSKTVSDAVDNVYKDDGMPQSVGFVQVLAKVRADRFAKVSEAIKNLRGESESGIRHLPKPYSENYQADMSAASTKADAMLEAVAASQSMFLSMVNTPFMAMAITGDEARSLGRHFGKTSNDFANSELAISKRMKDDEDKLAAAKEKDTKALFDAKNEWFFQAVITE